MNQLLTTLLVYCVFVWAFYWVISRLLLNGYMKATDVQECGFTMTISV